MGQLLLIPDARPLDQRLGTRFFRSVPGRPGVYLMKEAGGKVVYVGKAKDLKQRLNYYRVANPDRLPRRHLRMVREVREIEFHFCPNEAAALAHEARLLRSLKPKFNRAGVWPGKPSFVVWRCNDQHLEIAVVETPEPGWRRFGPLNGGARLLHGTLARLLWLALNENRGLADLPVGWADVEFPPQAMISGGPAVGEALALLDKFFWEAPALLLNWLAMRLSTRSSGFDRNGIDAELEVLREFAAKLTRPLPQRQQLALL